MARGKTEIAHQDSFSFGGKHVYVQIVEADGYTIELIEGQLENQGLRPDYSYPRIALLQRCIHKLKIDNKEVDLEPSATGKSKFPKIWDADVEETLTTRLLKLIINNVEPEMAQQHEDCFGKYLEDDEEDFTATSEGSVPFRLASAEGE